MRPFVKVTAQLALSDRIQHVGGLVEPVSRQREMLAKTAKGCLTAARGRGEG